MRYLYYCNSPYQLFNIINLNWHRKYNKFEKIDNYEADLVILNAFNGAEEIVNILMKDTMFNSVTLSSRLVNKGFTHKISTFLDFAIPNRYIKKATNNCFMKIKNNYDCLCMPKISNFMLAVWTQNKKAEIELFEEGFGSFCGGKHMTYEKNAHEWLYVLQNRGRKLRDCYQRIYLNNLDLYLDKDKEKLVKIPKVDDNCLLTIRKIFKDISLDIPNYEILWFGQYIVDNAVTKTIKVLNEHKDKVLYFPHPRYKEKSVFGFEQINKNKFWELNINNIKNIEDKCFLSMHSTAVFSPKILFDKEPYLILTINMIEDEAMKKDCAFVHEIINRFIESYRDKDKIMLPKDDKELHECVELYLSKLNLV